MGYIPQHALENLKKYSYKGVDKCVIASSPPPRPLDLSSLGRSSRDMFFSRTGRGSLICGRRGLLQTPYAPRRLFSQRSG